MSIPYDGNSSMGSLRNMPAIRPESLIPHYHPHLSGERAMNSNLLSTIASSHIWTGGSFQVHGVSLWISSREVLLLLHPAFLVMDLQLRDRSNGSAVRLVS